MQFVYDRRPDLAAASACADATSRGAGSAASAPRPAPPPPSGAADPVLEQVLALVAEKTGYPTDMLDPALDLEADLGIDTVKQAEMFATIREAYGIPRDDKLKLRDFPTLAHVVQFVYDRRPDLAATGHAASRGRGGGRRGLGRVWLRARAPRQQRRGVLSPRPRPRCCARRSTAARRRA